MKGRKAIPSKILELRGGRKLTHRPPRENEPKPPVKMPSCPKHLDSEAQKEWRRIAKLLKNVGLLTELDRGTLAAHCQFYSTWIQSAIKVQEMGMIYLEGRKVDKKGNVIKPGIPKTNPYIKIARESCEQMVKTGALLGLNPSSRASLKVEKPKEASKVEQFMKRKRG